MANRWLWLTGAALCYYLLAFAGMKLLTLEPSNRSLLWLPAGLAIIMWQREGWLALPFIWLASFAANYTGLADAVGLQAAIPHTAVAALADGLMAWLAVSLLRRFLPNGLHNAGSLIPFIFLVCLVPTAFSSLIICLNLLAGGIVDWDEAIYAFRVLTVGDSLSILLLYPLYMDIRSRGLPDSFSFWQLLLSAFVVVLGIQLSYSVIPGAIHLLLPFMLALVLSERRMEMLFLLLLAVVTILLKSTDGLGPFTIPDSREGVFMLMTFMWVLVVVPVGMLLYKQEQEAHIASGKKWQKRAGIDHLTGLSNRHVFMPILAAEYERSRRHGRPFSLAMLDIDHFKRLNDSRGHLVGDRALQALAQLLLKEVRTIDVVCRFGGEEFLILFPETASNYAAYALERFRHRLEDEGVDIGGEQLAITISIGMLAYEGGEETVEDLLEKVDKLLYKAKDKGRNRLETGLNRPPALGLT